MSVVKYTCQNRLARITLNRPEKRNALNEEMIRQLHDAFDQAANDPAVKIIILDSLGPVFCAGADLAYLQKLQSFTHEDNLADSHQLKELYARMYNLPKLIVGQVQGHALAGGCGLVTVCDVVVAAAGAKFGYTEVRIGFVPAIVMPFLIRKVGEGHARALLLGGGLIEADQALSLGLIHTIAAPDKLSAMVDEMVTGLIDENSAESMAMTKKLLGRVQDQTFDDALRSAEEANAFARSTEDCKRGIAAFLNKEKIKW